MLRAQNNIVAVFVGPGCSTGHQVLRCVFGDELVGVRWGAGTPLPEGLPRLIVVLVSPEAVDQVRDAVDATRAKYSNTPVLAVAEGGTRRFWEQIVEAQVDEIVVGTAEEQELRTICTELIRRHRSETCSPELLMKVASLNILGRSENLTTAIAQIPDLGKSQAPLLIRGETGTGKELFSRAIHYLGNRSGGPFVAVNCGGLPDQLLENELFGHVRGAYTDARADHRGMVHEAAGGTLLLDEVNSLSPLAQVKLLRFIESRRYKRVGSAREEYVDTRLICASNVNLLPEVEQGRFRDDLYYRISVLNLHLPSLRERKQDIPLLAHAFLEDFCQEYERSKLFLTRGALEKITAYAWPGNVRELRNVIERAVIMARFHIIRESDLDIPVADSGGFEPFQKARMRAIAQFERDYLTRVLAMNRGNISRAARYAQKDRRTFQRLLSKHGLRGAV